MENKSSRYKTPRSQKVWLSFKEACDCMIGLKCVLR